MSHMGYLVIADITGYTAFLSGSELEHARDSLNSLLSLLVDYTRRPLLISRLEGDAVFSYAFDEDVPYGQTLVELIDNTYLAFRKARDLMIVNTTCHCRACKNIPNLDLKFFLHHGAYDFQQIGDYKELVGTDVNLIHRLTKNNVVKTTGLKAYALYTNEAVEALGIEDLEAEMMPHSESYEHIGRVPVFIQDLNAVWQREQETLRFEIRPDDILFQHAAVFPLSPTALWDYLTRPEYRAVIHGSLGQKIVSGRLDRLGPNTVYECYHGRTIHWNTIVDWQPFKQYTTYENTPIPRTFVYVTYLLEPVEEGTRVGYIMSRSRGPFLLRSLSNLGAGRIIPERMKASFAAFRALIDEEIAAGRTGAEEPVQISGSQITKAVDQSLVQT